MIYKLVLRLQELAYNAVEQNVIGLAVLMANLAIGLTLLVGWAAFKHAHVRHAMLVALAGAAVVAGWIWLCQKIIRYMAHVYDAKLRIARAARGDY